MRKLIAADHQKTTMEINRAARKDFINQKDEIIDLTKNIARTITYSRFDYEHNLFVTIPRNDLIKVDHHYAKHPLMGYVCRYDAGVKKELKLMAESYNIEKVIKHGENYLSMLLNDEDLICKDTWIRKRGGNYLGTLDEHVGMKVGDFKLLLDETKIAKNLADASQKLIGYTYRLLNKSSELEGVHEVEGGDDN